jgi:hypothetical protein
MNIWGNELKIKKLDKELKKGRDDLGILKFNRLERRKQNLKNKIKKIKESRKHGKSRK